MVKINTASKTINQITEGDSSAATANAKQSTHSKANIVTTMKKDEFFVMFLYSWIQMYGWLFFFPVARSLSASLCSVCHTTPARGGGAPKLPLRLPCALSVL
ncbi:hypothetical protein DI09_402p10 [Mitosporidium daphniae]|uniref:Uncharacterized protein n=1 Tax=Mitosporidium daphniae TaxID=1485682 RepID=A0A098VQC9_9MICR|nr:hypothetical protein DI09_402p10 [Mitosporidium daphniae]|eukprot:XP_013237674.1 uncharacterized protein DI09_402p10 [Mitosporidium daphniae]